MRAKNIAQLSTFENGHALFGYIAKESSHMSLQSTPDKLAAGYAEGSAYSVDQFNVLMSDLAVHNCVIYTSFFRHN